MATSERLASSGRGHIPFGDAIVCVAQHGYCRNGSPITNRPILWVMRTSLIQPRSSFSTRLHFKTRRPARSATAAAMSSLDQATETSIPRFLEPSAHPILLECNFAPTSSICSTVRTSSRRPRRKTWRTRPALELCPWLALREFFSLG